jgi:hypothetical protein
MTKRQLMTRVAVLTWLFVLVPLTTVATLKYAYWPWYWGTFQKGFDRGAHFATRYKDCFGTNPSEQVLINASHFVNNPETMPCQWAKSMEKQ